MVFFDTNEYARIRNARMISTIGNPRAVESFHAKYMITAATSTILAMKSPMDSTACS